MKKWRKETNEKMKENKKWRKEIKGKIKEENEENEGMN